MVFVCLAACVDLEPPTSVCVEQNCPSIGDARLDPPVTPDPPPADMANPEPDPPEVSDAGAGAAEDGPADATDKLASGQSCTSAVDCASGFCADGVCCVSACTEVCSRCDQAQSLGTCAEIPGGEDPDNECGVEPSTSCGTVGSCDGAGRCKLHPSGTPCGSGSCSNGLETHPQTCDGAGWCRPATTAACNPFVCGPTACLAICDGQEDCVPPNSCVGGSCRLKPPGEDCTVAAQCASSFCQQGVCCSTACDRTCQSCAVAGSKGTCTNVRTGEDPLNQCAESNRSSCGSDGFCDGLGSCRLYEAGAVCAAQTCSSGVEFSARVCDGAGRCLDGAIRSCAPATCGPSGSCLSSCTTDTQCVSPNTCNGNVCSLKPMGRSCGSPSECASGLCQQGVCCDSTCAGVCRSCALSGREGTCSNVPSGQDVLNQCGDGGAASCGTTGTCNGMGACALYSAGTVCAAQTCGGAQRTSARTCDGLGACQTGTVASCSPYFCGTNNACASSCARHADCATGFYCSGGACGSLLVGLVAHWKLDDTSSPSRDSSGNNHNGTWNNTPVASLTVLAPLASGNVASLRFDQAELDRVRVSRAPTLEPAVVSVSMWVRRLGNTGQATRWSTMFRKAWNNNVSPTFGSYSMQLVQNDFSKVSFGTGHSGFTADLISASGLIPDNTWVHVVGVYNPAGPAPQKRLYVNGVLHASDTRTTPMIYDSTSAGDLYIGHGGGNMPTYYNGHLDDVRVYSRALSVDEITALASGQ